MVHKLQLFNLWYFKHKKMKKGLNYDCIYYIEGLWHLSDGHMGKYGPRLAEGHIANIGRGLPRAHICHMARAQVP